MRQSHDHTGRRTPRNRPNPSARNSKETARQIGNDRLLGPENRHRPARQFLHTGLRTSNSGKKRSNPSTVSDVLPTQTWRKEEDKTVCYQTELYTPRQSLTDRPNNLSRTRGHPHRPPAFSKYKTLEGVPPCPSLYPSYAGNVCTAGSKFPGPPHLLYKDFRSYKQ